MDLEHVENGVNAALRDQLEQGLHAGFIDSETQCSDKVRPSLIHNSKETGSNLLSVIRQQFTTCSSFDICVAFVANSGLQPLVDVLADLQSRGIHGRFLTSTYLNFNDPQAFRKLLEYNNIEVRVYEGNLHAKGYLFSHEEISTVIVGSSNLTQAALTCNREWNVLFRSYPQGDMLLSAQKEFRELWEDKSTKPVTNTWIDAYESYRAKEPARRKRLNDFEFSRWVAGENNSESTTVEPNEMQRSALESLRLIHEREEDRALLISSTGTGKTYLSAFDVQNVQPKTVLFLVHREEILKKSLKSYQQLLGNRYTYGIYKPSSINAGNKLPTCLFAMCSTMINHIEEFNPKQFDYIVIDEAHRAGSMTYQKITAYFKPLFMLGMTATPERTNNDYDIFGLFRHIIAYRITLQDALANDMLVPFHYFGIADLTINDNDIDDVTLFSRLTSNERVRHIINKIEEYTVDKANRKGLIFCSRNEEAEELSRKFNDVGYRTLAISGATDSKARETAISRLESGELQYLFSVDVFNKGVDIPSLNQIIMLRQTESAIVFVQQLGRGLRKLNGKDYTLVLDFIGNYKKNFLVPVALSGDRTYNKDNLRAIVKRGSSVIPGCSTISFDRISEARIYRAIDGGNFTNARDLRAAYLNLRRMLGRIPKLIEFDLNGSIDPMLIFNNGSLGSYHEFLSKYDNEYKRMDETNFTDNQRSILKFISKKLASGKRQEDLLLLQQLVSTFPAVSEISIENLIADQKGTSRVQTWSSAIRVLSGSFYSQKGFIPLLDGEIRWRISNQFAKCLENDEFKRQILEAIEFGLHRHALRYANPYRGTSFVLNEKYTYEEVCRLLEWERNEIPNSIGGYKYDKQTNTLPIFINYDKDPSISSSIRYEDRFVSNSELIALSKHPRSLDSNDIQTIQNQPTNGVKIYLFMRKNKNDKGSKEFYFFGDMTSMNAFNQITMPETSDTAVEIKYRLETPVEENLYSFMTASLDEND